MEKEYDVIIVGAGVSGFMLAYFLNNTNLKVLLMDKRKELSKLENIRFGTLMEAVNTFGLKKAIIAKYRSFAFGLDDPKTWAISKHEHEPFVIIDMKKFARTVTLDCEKKLGCEIKSLQRKNKQIEITDKQGVKYRAKIVVDCSGISQVVAKKLNIPETRDSTYFYNTSLELVNCDIPKEYSKIGSFPGSKKYTNILLWVYPYSTSECQFGHTDWANKKYPVVKNQDQIIYHLMKNVYPYNEWFKNARIVGKVRRPSFATITRPIFDDNYLACGEAAGATPPALGEGSRAGIYMAKYAQEIIAEAFEFNDFSKNQLRKYEERFREGMGKYYRNCEIVRHFIWHYTDDDDYKYFFSRILDRLSERDYIGFLRSEFTLKLCVKLIGFRGALRIAKNIIKRHIFGIKIEDLHMVPNGKL